MPINSRNKGATGERELAGLIKDHLGYDVKRNLEQTRNGGSDLLGVPGWSIECKRHATATRGEIQAWWEQAVEQAVTEIKLPVLCYRKDKDGWRAVIYPEQHAPKEVGSMPYRRTLEMDLGMWFEMVREGVNKRTERADDYDRQWCSFLPVTDCTGCHIYNGNFHCYKKCVREWSIRITKETQ